MQCPFEHGKKGKNRAKNSPTHNLATIIHSLKEGRTIDATFLNYESMDVKI